MGQDVSNVGLRGHGRSGAARLELWHHFGDEGLDEATVLTAPQAEALIQAAQQGQGAFDALAGALAPWYAFPTLTGPQRDDARASCRAGVMVFAGLQT